MLCDIDLLYVSTVLAGCFSGQNNFPKSKITYISF